jgi:hypothetical protein
MSKLLCFRDYAGVTTKKVFENLTNYPSFGVYDPITQSISHHENHRCPSRVPECPSARVPERVFELCRVARLEAEANLAFLMGHPAEFCWWIARPGQRYQKTMENHHAMKMGKSTIKTGSFSIANCLFARGHSLCISLICYKGS